MKERLFNGVLTRYDRVLFNPETKMVVSYEQLYEYYPEIAKEITTLYNQSNIEIEYGEYKGGYQVVDRILTPEQDGIDVNDYGKLIIYLNGTEGNAFVLLNYVEKLITLFDLPLNPKPIFEIMLSKDYEYLLEVFGGYFKDYVTLKR